MTIKKHNNKNIRIIKYLLVLIAMIASLTMGYYALMNENNKVDKTQQANNSDDTNINYKVASPSLVGISFDHGPYYIESKDMEEIAGNITFINPQIKMMIKHIDWFNLTSKLAKLKTNDNQLELYDDVEANINNQYFANTQQAEIISQDSLIKSDKYINIYTEGSSLESETGFVANYNNQTAFFFGKINTNIENTDKSITNIKSDKFNIFWNDKTGHFIGNVVLVNGETTVKADKMIALLNKNNNELEKIFLYKNVRIITEEQTSTSEYGEYIIATSNLTLTDNVRLHKQKNIMNGEALHYNFKTKKANLVGAKNTTKKGKKKRVQATIIPKSKAFEK